MQPAIGIDYDGTIADTNAIKAAWIRKNLGLDVPPWKTDRTMCVPLIGLENYEQMGREIYEHDASMQAPEVPGATAAIKALSDHYTIYIVTARQHLQIEWSKLWMAKMGLAACIAGYLSSGSTNPDGSLVSKHQLGERYGLSVLIDDDERHLRDVGSGLRRILLKNGCNEPLAVSPGIELARSWAEALRLLGF